MVVEIGFKKRIDLFEDFIKRGVVQRFSKKERVDV